ncbi:MAG: DUF952 domain-containing protein [Bacteroidetes bacterium]|nr:DUF952 domain-containing protein [Bacteroidota bacterium]MCB0843202.1 DUF952 domain-containing protein [Bacteroidota bacterium]
MIYHIIQPSQWQKVMDRDSYKPESLKTEGFIHCSSKTQVLPTAKLYFSEASELVVIGIVDKRVKNILKWEVSRDGEEFPHLYGPLPLSAVETMDMIMRRPDGEWEWV